jgi:hypothetical protein
MYKSKKYLFKFINSSELINNYYIKQPECQRYLDNEQINKLLDYQIKHFNKYNEFFFTNPITLGLYNEIHYIIDGQHRLNCITKLIKLKYDDFKIPVVILYIDSISELDNKYMAINSNKPIPLSKNINDWKFFGKHVEKHFIDNFSKYISNSNKPNPPNINIDNLIKYINQNNIANKIDINVFIKEIDKLNIYYQQTYLTTLVKYFSKNIMKQINKSKLKQENNPLLLSLYKNYEWIERIIYKNNNNMDYESIVHIPKDHRVKIKIKLKREIWKKRFINKMNGECYVCDEGIDYDNFHCGHIKSLFYGGKTKLSNLEPICSKCNINMGTNNLEEYKNELNTELC